MKLATIKIGLFGFGTSVLAMSIIMSGMMLAPNSASAFWWPWGDNHVYAQGGNDDDDDESPVTVTIQKYIDGELATSESAGGSAFPMTASWDDPDGIGAGSGAYTLASTTSPAYQAVTAEMQVGADYSTSEVLDGDLVAATCGDDHAYELVGYSVGTTSAAAAAATVSATAPSFTNLTSDKYVIVWNETCDDDTDTATSSGSISGEVTGGASDEDPGELMVTSIDALKTTAIANGQFADGWRYLFNITVPTDETDLAMKFSDWTQSGTDHILPVAGNMRISSDQASDSNLVVTLNAADTYSTPELIMTGDLNEDEDGLQVQVLVEVAVPSDTFNGTYSTNYGVRTLP